MPKKKKKIDGRYAGVIPFLKLTDWKQRHLSWKRRNRDVREIIEDDDDPTSMVVYGMEVEYRVAWWWWVSFYMWIYLAMPFQYIFNTEKYWPLYQDLRKKKKKKRQWKWWGSHWPKCWMKPTQQRNPGFWSTQLLHSVVVIPKAILHPTFKTTQIGIFHFTQNRTSHVFSIQMNGFLRLKAKNRTRKEKREGHLPDEPLFSSSSLVSGKLGGCHFTETKQLSFPFHQHASVLISENKAKMNSLRN